jgi:hypothetical protein
MSHCCGIYGARTCAEALMSHRRRLVVQWPVPNISASAASEVLVLLHAYGEMGSTIAGRPILCAEPARPAAHRKMSRPALLCSSRRSATSKLSNIYRAAVRLAPEM